MNIGRKFQINDFERLDGDGDASPQLQTSAKPSLKKKGREHPAGSTSDHYRAVKKSHSAKAISKAKKLVKNSKYSSLDGAFPTAVVNNANVEKKSTIDWTRSTATIPIKSKPELPTETDSETKDEFYFEANFEARGGAHNSDHYFEAIFEGDCEDERPPVTSCEINMQEEASKQSSSDSDKGRDRPLTPNTVASSNESRASTPGASVFLSTSTEDSSIDKSAMSDGKSTTDESVNKTAKNFFLGKRSSYQKLDCHSPADEVPIDLDQQNELDQRLNAIHKLKDVTIEQSKKKIKKMLLADRANKIRLILFRKEITYLRLQNADLKERVTKLEDDLRTAKDDAVVSEEEANRMCTALVLIRKEIDDAETRTQKLGDGFEVENLFACVERGEVNDFHSNVAEGVKGEGEGGDPFADEDLDIKFDAFGLYEKT